MALVLCLFRAQSTHSPVMEADLQLVRRLNGGNLRDTGHSFEAGPMAALAEIQTNDSEVGLFWSPQATPRPILPLGSSSVSGGNLAVSRHSSATRIERQLSRPGSTYYRPKTAIKRHPEN